MSNESASTANATAPANKLRIFFDADALISGSAPQSRQSASYILLQLSELTLIEGVYCPYVAEQAKRNILAELPSAIDEFNRILKAALSSVPDAPLEALQKFSHYAHKTDVPVLAAAIRSGCRFLITFNVKDFRPPAGVLEVLRPGDMIKRLRSSMSSA